WSASPKVYSGDVNYEYRQESNFFYLTGVTAEDAILVLMPGNAKQREMLFIKRKDPAREIWQGQALSPAQATALSGIQTVLTTDEFEPFVAATLGRRDFYRLPSHECAAFFEALAAGRGRVGLLFGVERVDAPLTPPMEFARAIRDRFPGFQTVDVLPILTDLRLVKTPYERRILARSVDISSEAQMAGMLAAHPGAYEYEVKAAFEAIHRSRGAGSWAYPSIVGSGPNATTLHYPEDGRQMRAGELLLVDAGASYQYMAADITRTYPVNGTFSSAQRDLYNVVLQAQEEGMKVAK